MIDLQTYGYNNQIAAAVAGLGLTGCVPGRVVADYGSYLRVAVPEGYDCEISGSLMHRSEKYQLPKVGDWVVIQPSDLNKAVVQVVLPRTSEINRKTAGNSNDRQVLATNIDIAFVVQALDLDFNLMRLERYSYQLRQSHIEPVFIFNKADKSVDLDAKLHQIEALGVPYIITSAIKHEGIDKIKALIHDSKTAVLLGSSGVGKSTLTNALLGAYHQKTAAIRESDSTGRHTTSHRELFLLPGGGMIIDTPGIRELQLWGEAEYLDQSFQDIETLALGCAFNNCSHVKEAHCAVLAAVASGNLASTRLDSYHKFKNELQTQAFAAASLSAKHKKQRARRMRKVIEMDERLDDYSDLS